MSLLEFLGLSGSKRDQSAMPPLAAAIQRELGGLAADRVERIAAWAGLLVRVAHADVDVSDDERAKLIEIIAARSELSPAEATAVGSLVIRQATELEGIDYALLTRAFNDFAGTEEKERLIDCLYAVATADDEVSMAEDDEIRAVARALLLSHDQFIRIRQRYKEKLEVIRSLRKLDPGA
jgi:uncharacterized tellurite resistance protein B-like protein